MKKSKLHPFIKYSILITFFALIGCTHLQGNKQTQLRDLLKEADSLYQGGQLDSAATLYKEAVNLEKFQPYIYYRLGNIAFKQNKLLESQDWYIKSLQLKPNFIKAHHNLSIVYLTLAKPHMDYFNNNANKKQTDDQLVKISEMIDFYSKYQKQALEKNTN